MTLLNIGLIILGVILVIWGADRLTDGAASLARGMRVPEIVIGLTILAAGTSAPELFVSLVSALKGTSDLAVGNVIGSNIFNTMLIVGCSAVVAPMAIAKTTVTKDIPFAVGASLLLFLLCFDDMSSPHLWGNDISRSDGLILLAVFVAFMMYTFSLARKNGEFPDGDDEEEEDDDLQVAVPKSVPTWKNVMWIVIGLACLIVGSNIFVDGASYIAYRFGVRQSVVGLTIVAGGTSLPELATSVVAARKGQSALAIGNAIGSNVFNILLILGLTATVCPMRIMGISIIDLSMMLVSMGLLWIFAYTKYTVSRREGWLMILGFFAYMAWLFYLL
jgi:cation:H+ antiporter